MGLDLSLRKHFDEMKDSASNIVTVYFRTEVAAQIDLLEKEHKLKGWDEKKRRRLRDILFGAPHQPNGKLSEQHEKDGEIRFKNENDAKLFIKKITDDGLSNINSKFDITKTSINRSIDDFQTAFTQEIQSQIAEIINSTSQELEKAGFHGIELALPSPGTLRLPASGALILDKLIEAKSEKVTRHRRQSGAWGTICSWVNTDDWGWETYEAEECYKSINLEKVIDSITKSIAGMLDAVSQEMKTVIELPLQQNINQYFDQVGQVVEDIRQALIQGKKDQEISIEQQKRLIAHLAKTSKKLEASEIDLTQLKAEIATFHGVSQ